MRAQLRCYFARVSYASLGRSLSRSSDSERPVSIRYDWNPIGGRPIPSPDSYCALPVISTPW